MENKITHRFSSAAWMDQELPPLRVSIIGAGSTGSHVAYMLSKYADVIDIWDCDAIEEHNLGTQLYPYELIGERKTDALLEVLKSLSNVNAPNHSRVMVNDSFFKIYYRIQPIVVACTDNIESRREAFNAWQSLDDKILFVDIRMGGEYGQVFYVTPDHQRIKAYEKTFEGKFEDPICTLRLTLPVTLWACGIAVQGINNHRAGLYVPFELFVQGPVLAQTVTYADTYLDADRPTSDDAIRSERPVEEEHSPLSESSVAS